MNEEELDKAFDKLYKLDYENNIIKVIMEGACL